MKKMTEAAYAYIDDVKNRKYAVAAAKKTKHGSKSKKCTLPSDYLTRSQKQKLNGEVKTYKMGQPMIWEDFKQMPEGYQENYLASLMNTYDCRSADLGRMFGVTGGTVNKWVKEHNFTKVKLHGPGTQMSKEKRAAWNDWLLQHNWIHPEITAQELPASIMEAPTGELKVDTENEEIVSPMTITNLDVSFEGKINLKDIVAYLQLTLGEDIRGHMEISFHG